MKIILRTDKHLMYASFDGKVAPQLLSMLMPITVSVASVDPKKKCFKFIEDRVIPLMYMGQESVKIFCNKDSYAVVEN